MKPVTDPAVLEQLEGRKVTDPELLKQLEGQPPRPSGTFQKIREAVAPLTALSAFTPGLGLFSLADVPAQARGLVRGLKDFKETGLQLVTGGEPGEVYGRQDRPYSPHLKPFVDIPAVARRLGIGPADEAERQQLNEAATRERQAFDRDEGAVAKVSRFTTSLAPWLLLRTPARLSVMPGLGGFAARTGYSGLTGAGIGAAQFVPEGQDRLENAALTGAGSALFGGGLELLASQLPARVIARGGGIREALKTPEGRKGLALTRDTGQDFKLSQVLGSERLAGMEREAAAARPDITRPDTNRMISQFMNRLEGIQNMVDPKHSTPGRTAKAILPAYKAELDRTLATRSTMFTERLAEAEKLVKGQPVIPTGPIIEDLQAELKAATTAVQSETTRKYVGKLTQEIKKLSGANKLTMTNVQRLMQDYGEAASGTGRMFKDIDSAADRRVYTKLQEAMLNALDRATKDPALGPAAGALKSARDDYRLLSQYKDQMETNALGRVLNMTEDAVTPEGILAAVSKLKPSEVRQVLPLIQNHDPEIIGALQRNYFRDILKRSGTGDAATAGVHPVSMRKFAENWQTDDYFRALFPDRQTRHELIRARQALRRLADEMPPKHAPGAVEKRTEEAGILGSLNPVFILRMVARRMTPTKMAKLLHTPEGRMALIRAAEPKHYTPSEIAASIGYLNRLEAEAEPPP